MNTFPEKIDLFAISLQHDFDAPESLGFEILDSEVSIDHESQGGELTGSWKRDEIGPFTGELILPTVADDLFLQDGGHGLKLESLQTSKGSADSQIKLNPSGHCICLELIEFNRLSGRLKNMADK